MSPRTYLGVPLVVRVDVQIVPRNDHKSRGRELLFGDVDVHHGLLAHGVLGYASQEVTHDELVQASLVALMCEENNK